MKDKECFFLPFQRDAWEEVPPIPEGVECDWQWDRDELGEITRETVSPRPVSTPPPDENPQYMYNSKNRKKQREIARIFRQIFREAPKFKGMVCRNRREKAWNILAYLRTLNRSRGKNI